MKRRAFTQLLLSSIASFTLFRAMPSLDLIGKPKESTVIVTGFDVNGAKIEHEMVIFDHNPVISTTPIMYIERITIIGEAFPLDVGTMEYSPSGM